MSTLCEFVQVGRWWVCSACGTRRRRKVVRACIGTHCGKCGTALEGMRFYSLKCKCLGPVVLRCPKCVREAARADLQSALVAQQ